MLKHEASATDETDTSFLSMTEVYLKDCSGRQDCNNRKTTAFALQNLINN
jgi:hypothetical protein